jgi:hypothetical protein
MLNPIDSLGVVILRGASTVWLKQNCTEKAVNPASDKSNAYFFMPLGLLETGW